MYNYQMQYKSNKNVTYSCKYHVVWCPKYRRDVIVGAVEQRLKNIISLVCEKREAELIELETIVDPAEKVFMKRP